MSTTTPSRAATGTRARRGTAALEVFLGGASYGVMGTTYKLAYAAGFTWQQVVASQAIFAAALFAVATAVQAARGTVLVRLGARRLAGLLALGALTCCTSILYCYALSRVPVPVALTLLFQYTWLGIPLQLVLDGRRPTRWEVLSAVVILAGTVLASGIATVGLGGLPALPLACALLAALTCASFVTLSGRTGTGVPVGQRGLAICLGTAATSLVVCPDYLSSGVLVRGILPYALMVGCFGAFLPVMLFGLGGPHLSPATSTVLASAELPFGLLVSMLVLGEPMGAAQWAGVAVVLAGVALSQAPALLSRARGRGGVARGSGTGSLGERA